MRIETVAKLGNIPGLRRADDGAYRPRFALWAGGPFLQVSGEQLDRFVAPLFCDLIDRAAICVGSCGIEARGEGASHGFDISSACSLEHVLSVVVGGTDAVDVRFQCAPALEARVARDREPCWVQSCTSGPSALL